MSQAKVLIVEDDSSLREALCDTLELAGYTIAAAADGRTAIDFLERDNVGMVVTDVQMPRMDGNSLLKRIRNRQPDIPVVLMTAYGTVQKAVEAMRNGASDYLLKPFEADTLVEMVARFLPQRNNEPRMVAEDQRTLELVALAARVARTDATVMISGESGTGKEVLAQFIHEQSARVAAPFVAINCAAIPENMLEAVLFGYEKGAFTGAYQARPGKFEQAQGGTLLLDEISEMDLGLQAKLLRVLQEREVERLGGKELIPLDVRVLATSNRVMREEVAAGNFREDLFYRLNVFPLFLAPLRERRNDILPIAQRLVERHCPAREPVPKISDRAQSILVAHDWPGNVRELENVVQRALILKSGDRIEAEDLHFELAPADVSASVAAASVPGVGEDLGSDLKHREQELILDALKADKGNRKAVAERLGISPRTLRYKLARMREAGVALPA
jgi:two-component system response regulator FlrC